MRKTLSLKPTSIIYLYDMLSSKCFSVFVRIIPMLSSSQYSFTNGKYALTLEDISEMIGIDYSNLTRIFKIYTKNGLISKLDNVIYANPYIFSNQIECSDMVLDLFCDTYFAIELYEEKEITRQSPSYRKFVKNVILRDSYKCVCCNNESNLEVHHIYPYAKYKTMRDDTNNGVTLCQCCHSSMILGGFHQIYGTYNNTQEQLQEYIDNKRENLGLPRITIDEIINK